MNAENSRRAISRLAGAGLLALTAATAFLPAARSACSADKPNIILILADDMGWRDAGCFGGTAVPTPAIDAASKKRSWRAGELALRRTK